MASKKSLKVDMMLQYGGCDYDLNGLTERVCENYAEYGNADAKVDSIRIYLKPEDGKAYYVINDTVTGSVDL